MSWFKKQPPDDFIVSLEAARTLYAAKVEYINRMNELPDEEREFLLGIARADLLKKAAIYLDTKES